MSQIWGQTPRERIREASAVTSRVQAGYASVLCERVETYRAEAPGELGRRLAGRSRRVLYGVASAARPVTRNRSAG